MQTSEGWTKQTIFHTGDYKKFKYSYMVNLTCYHIGYIMLNWLFINSNCMCEWYEGKRRQYYRYVNYITRKWDNNICKFGNWFYD